MNKVLSILASTNLVLWLDGLY